MLTQDHRKWGGSWESSRRVGGLAQEHGGEEEEGEEEEGGALIKSNKTGTHIDELGPIGAWPLGTTINFEFRHIDYDNRKHCFFK